MSALDLYKNINAFIPKTEQEKSDKAIILNLIAQYPDNILTRSNCLAHMTSSGFIFNEDFDHCLMVFHNIYQSWSWSGGHADGCSDLLSVALKEALEETDLADIKPFSSDIISLDILPVFGHLKNNQYVSSHLHISTAFSLIGNMTSSLKSKPDENSAVAWIPLSEIENYCSEPHMLSIYQKIIKRTKG